jgi:cytochrome c
MALKDCNRIHESNNFPKKDSFMKRILVAIATIAAGIAVSTPALADLKLATAKNCMACHAVDKKLVGPSYKDVAAKYAGQSDAVDKLSVKVMKGGAGVWGPVPMPANGL